MPRQPRKGNRERQVSTAQPPEWRPLQFFRPSTLRQGLTWIVIAALLPLVIVSVVQGLATLENIRTLADSRLNAKAVAVAERERDRFVIAQHLLMTAAANPDVISMSDRCNEALAASLRDYRAIVNFVRSDANGNVRCSVLPHSGNVNLATEGWWQRGIRANRLTLIKSPIIGAISQKEIIILMIPLLTAEGRQNGALSVGISLSDLRRSIAAAPEGRSGYLAVMSRDGAVIAEGSSKLDIRPASLPPQVRSLVAKTRSGEEWKYSIARLYSDQLVVLYAQPHQQLMATGISQARASFLLPLISILLASLAIWFGTHRLIVRWLRNLGAITLKFAHGDFTGDRQKFEDAPEEIASLSADLHAMADVIDKRNREITIVLEAKTQLTHEVHHRVKNNLQIINSMLTLQAGRVGEEGAKAVLSQTMARISALALIHRLLYEEDANSELGRVAVKDLFEGLCRQLRSTRGKTGEVELECEAHVDGDGISVDLAVPLALFAVEAVTNAYRHAFGENDKGIIHVGFAHDALCATLTIADNGCGYDASQPGMMGMELMQAFAIQLNGKLAVNSVPGEGTRITLEMPLNYSNETVLAGSA